MAEVTVINLISSFSVGILVVKGTKRTSVVSIQCLVCASEVQPALGIDCFIAVLLHCLSSQVGALGFAELHSSGAVDPESKPAT